MWVTLPIFWKAVTVSSHPTLWPTASKWHFTFSKRQFHHLVLWPTVCEWHCTYLWKSSHIFPITNSMWVTSAFFWEIVSAHLVLLTTGCDWHSTLFWKVVSSHLVPWSTESEWHSLYLSKNQSFLSQQYVSNAHLYNCALNPSCPTTTGSEWYGKFFS